MTTQPAAFTGAIPGELTAPGLMARLLSERGWVEILAAGFSMHPFIHSGDICRFDAVDAVDAVDTGDASQISDIGRIPFCVRQGEVVLFVMGGDRLVAHRVIRFVQQDGRSFVVTKGDNLNHPDERVPLSSVLGRLAEIRRNGVRLDIHSRSARTWGYIAVRHPRLVRGIRRLVERRFIPDWVANVWRSGR